MIHNVHAYLKEYNCMLTIEHRRKKQKQKNRRSGQRNIEN